MYKLKNTNRIHKYDTQKHEMGIKGGTNVDINSLQNKLQVKGTVMSIICQLLTK